MRAGHRVATVAALAGIAVAGLATPALAHVEVSADKAVVGARNVTLTFHGEAESASAGIRSERVVLPSGVDPAGVSVVRMPAGWTFTRAADGFTIGGKPLKVGADAVWRVRIAELPRDQTRLPFKTLETYGDGAVSRWIEIPQPGQPEPDNPAPLLVLKDGPAEAPASTAAPAQSPQVALSMTPPSVISVSAVAVAEPGAPPAENAGVPWWVWALSLIAVLAGAVVAVRVRQNRG